MTSIRLPFHVSWNDYFFSNAADLRGYPAGIAKNRTCGIQSYANRSVDILLKRPDILCVPYI